MLFFLLIFGVQVSSQVCEPYICKSLSNNQCVSPSGSSVYVQSCPSGYFCDRQPYPQPSYCSRKSTSLPYVWPGEPCQSAQCAYGYCNGTYCVGKEYNDTCNLTDECNPGLYCDSGLCNYLLSTNSKGCTSDFDCTYVSGCMSGVCTKYNSIRESNLVNCVNNQSEFCQSGSCFDNYCLANLSNDNGEGAKCQSYQDCLNTLYNMEIYPVVFYTECSCGLNGVKYCGLFPGDITVQTYRTSMNDWIDSGHISSCNTVRRFAPGCIKTMWHSDRYVKLMYYRYLVGNYSDIYNADSCVLNVLYPDYLTYEKSYHSFSSMLSFTLALTLLDS